MLNSQLSVLRRQRKKYLDGDRELTEAVTNVSHDLRTPLTVISGYLEMMEDKEKDAELSGYLDHIKNRVKAMNRLTEELFRYTVIHQQQELKLETVELRQLLSETALSYYSVFSEKGISPKVNIPDFPVYVVGNKNAIVRIIENILSNVAKYSDGDLKIELKSDGEATFSNSAKALNEVITEKLFNRFFTVETARSSTGLGLSIAKTLSERMNGFLTAEYSDGRLTIRLKLQTPPENEKTEG